MNSRISRRKLISVAGATATGAVIGEAGCDREPIRVNLICHGMMMFYFDKSDQDHFTILIPPVKGHKYSLTTNTGKYRHSDGNLLVGEDDMSRPGHYELNVESSRNGTFKRGDSNFYPNQGKCPDRSGDVVLYHEGDSGQSLSINNDSILFFIRVPYPTDIVPLRKISFAKRDPFGEKGCAVCYFPVRPAQIGGVHVFTYEAAANPVTLRRHNEKPVRIAAKGSSLNIHLYAQATSLAEMDTSAIMSFNKMASYTASSQPVPLDLCPKTDCQRDHMYPVACSPLDQELSLEDLEDLVEITTLHSIGSNSNLRLRQSTIAELESATTLLPVDCLQGYGT